MKMNDAQDKNKQLANLLELFWQTFPPIWHSAGSITRQTATEEFGITAAQFHTLRRIAEGNTSVSVLADCMHLSRPNISRSVDELVQSGLVERERESHDRRNIKLSLTSKGKQLIDNMHEVIGLKMKAKFANLDADEILTIQSALISLQRIFGRQKNPLNHT